MVWCIHRFILFTIHIIYQGSPPIKRFVQSKSSQNCWNHAHGRCGSQMSFVTLIWYEQCLASYRFHTNTSNNVREAVIKNKQSNRSSPPDFACLIVILDVFYAFGFFIMVSIAFWTVHIDHLSPPLFGKIPNLYRFFLMTASLINFNVW